MKKYLVTSLVIGILLFFNCSIFAQKHPEKHNKNTKTHRVQKYNNKPSHVKAYKYPRNKVVVIKKRNIRTVAVLPVGHTTILFKGRNYFYDAGYYYNFVGNTYSLIAPPIGIRIKILPPDHKKIFINKVPHFYYMGVYYKQIDNEYQIVEPTIGTVVPELPTDNVEEITIDGNKYYEYDNFLFKAIVTENGVQYEVVGKLDE